jgi:non-ribosomal peptide synthetase component F
MHEFRVPGGELVGVAQERGVHMGTTILGILRAGLVHAPMDLDCPENRLCHTDEDSGVELVIGAKFPPMTRARKIAPDELRSLGDPRSVGSVPADPAAAAYVICTPGSTGRPQGVIVSHRNVLAHRRRPE